VLRALHPRTEAGTRPADEPDVAAALAGSALGND
jgi:hypothetical protein